MVNLFNIGKSGKWSLIHISVHSLQCLTQSIGSAGADTVRCGNLLIELWSNIEGFGIDGISCTGLFPCYGNVPRRTEESSGGTWRHRWQWSSPNVFDNPSEFNVQPRSVHQKSGFAKPCWGYFRIWTKASKTSFSSVVICSWIHRDRRICPRRFFSDRNLFAIISSVLSVFDILPPVDDKGNPTKLEYKPTTGFISWAFNTLTFALLSDAVVLKISLSFLVLHYTKNLREKEAHPRSTNSELNLISVPALSIFFSY